VGQVGDSGWTERPHLHIQAMRAADGDHWHGSPLPMRFGERFLVKNQVVNARLRPRSPSAEVDSVVLRPGPGQTPPP
jgi:hypothetical protein